MYASPLAIRARLVCKGVSTREAAIESHAVLLCPRRPCRRLALVRLIYSLPCAERLCLPSSPASPLYVCLGLYLFLTAQLERKHKGTGKTASGNEDGVSPPSAVKKKKCKNLEVPFSNDRHVSVPDRKRDRRMKEGKKEGACISMSS